MPSRAAKRSHRKMKHDLEALITALPTERFNELKRLVLTNPHMEDGLAPADRARGFVPDDGDHSVPESWKRMSLNFWVEYNDNAEPVRFLPKQRLSLILGDLPLPPLNHDDPCTTHSPPKRHPSKTGLCKFSILYRPLTTLPRKGFGFMNSDEGLSFLHFRCDGDTVLCYRQHWKHGNTCDLPENFAALHRPDEIIVNIFGHTQHLRMKNMGQWTFVKEKIDHFLEQPAAHPPFFAHRKHF